MSKRLEMSMEEMRCAVPSWEEGDTIASVSEELGELFLRTGSLQNEIDASYAKIAELRDAICKEENRIKELAEELRPVQAWAKQVALMLGQHLAAARAKARANGAG